MQDFVHTISLSTPVDEDLRQAFADMLNATQNAMNSIAYKQARLQKKNDDLQREVASLRANTGRPREGGGSSNSQPLDGEDDGKNFQRVARVAIHADPVHSVTIARQGEDANRIMASASWDGTVKLYNLETSSVVQTTPKWGGLYSVAFAKTAPDIIGCTSCDNSVYLWNYREGKQVNKLQGHTDEVNGIDFHSTQQVMCTASDDCKVIVWDFQEGITLRTLDKHTKAVYGCTFLGKENEYFLATCCFDQKTRVFDMRDKKVVHMFESHTDDVIGIDYSSDRQLLATGSDDGTIILWDTRTWKRTSTMNTRTMKGLEQNEVKRIAFSPDGSVLAAACSSECVLVYDTYQSVGAQVAQLKGHTQCVFDVAWGIDAPTNSKILVSASHDKTSSMWRASSI